MEYLETYKGFEIYFFKGVYKLKKKGEEKYFDDSFTSRERAYHCIDRIYMRKTGEASLERKKVKETKKKVAADIKKNSEEYEKAITGE